MKVVELKVVNQFSRETVSCPIPFWSHWEDVIYLLEKGRATLFPRSAFFLQQFPATWGWSRDLQTINLIWMETARPSFGRRMLRWKRRRETGKRRKQNLFDHQSSALFLGEILIILIGYCSELNKFLNKVEWIGIWNGATNISCGYEHFMWNRSKVGWK